MAVVARSPKQSHPGTSETIAFSVASRVIFRSDQRSECVTDVEYFPRDRPGVKSVHGDGERLPASERSVAAKVKCPFNLLPIQMQLSPQHTLNNYKNLASDTKNIQQQACFSNRLLSFSSVQLASLFKRNFYSFFCSSHPKFVLVALQSYTHRILRPRVTSLQRVSCQGRTLC